MSQFYRVDYRKLTFREYWNLSPNWKAIVAWLLKVLGQPLRDANAFPDPSTYGDYQITQEQLPPEVMSATATVRQQVEELGFHAPKWLHIPPVHGIVTMSAAAYLHPSGEVLGRILHTTAKTGTVNVEQLTTAFSTPLKDGRVLVSTNMRESFRGGPPNMIVERRVGAPPPELFDAHMKRLKELLRTTEVQKITTADDRDEFIDRQEKEIHEFHVRRGLYAPLTEAEMTQKKNESAAMETALAAGERYPRVFAEIERIQNKKASWTSTLMILAISIAAFIALGFFRWSWETIVILLGVLFFHEMGHYVAMRLFNYQNLRMFFIPLLGAAVFGRNYNVKGWQKAIVSLAGPLPGIVAGGMLGLFAIVADQAWASKVALMALLLNGINLLPILPLDGGWLMHTLVFCRRYWLEGAFHLLAGLVMIGYRFAGGEGIFLFLGILMLFTSPMAFRLARVAHRLRARGISGVSHDQQTIPRETGEAIIDEIKAGTPGNHNDKTLASLTLNVFEKLNATPPSLGASILLFAAYVAPMIFALLFGGILMVVKPGAKASSRLVDTAFAPKHSYMCGTTERAGSNFTVPVSIVASTFGSREEAQTSFRESTNALKGETVALFGQTVFRATSELLERSTNKQIIVERPASNTLATVFLSCKAPDEAAAATTLTNELHAYLELAPMFLIVPPWVPQQDLPADKRVEYERARYTYQRIQNGFLAMYQDPKYKSAIDELVPKRKSKKKDELTKIMSEIERFSAEFQRETLLELKRDTSGRLDAVLIDLYLQEPERSSSLPAPSNGPSEERTKWWKEIGERLGKAPETSSRLPVTESGWFALKSGLVQQKGTTLRLQYLRFWRTDLGLPALAEFLCSRGCTDIRYSLQSFADEDEEDE